MKHCAPDGKIRAEEKQLREPAPGSTFSNQAGFLLVIEAKWIWCVKVLLGDFLFGISSTSRF